jgi:hypothetical protein
MALKKFRGRLMIHKHRGERWTVRTNADGHSAVYLWLEEHFGNEEFDFGPWARMSEQGWAEEYSLYDITSREIVTMMALRWS